MWDKYDYYEESDRPPDRVELEAQEALRAFFDAHQQDVFYSRQLEVRCVSKISISIGLRIVRCAP